MLVSHAQGDPKPPHQVGDVRDVKPVSEPTLEAIAVEKRREKLQIFLFPVLWSGGHQ